jgi:hypothetical protein
MMKTKNLIITTVWIAVAALIWSCDEGKTDVPELPQENLFVDNILQNSSSALSKVRGIGFVGPIGAIYGNFGRAFGGRTSETPSSIMRSMNKTESDSTDVPDCLIEMWEDDGNGNYTFTLDFGDGCDYYGEFMKGKMVETGNYSDNSFASSVTYTEFGGEDWSIDGTYSYIGTWEDNATDNPDNEEDSAKWEFIADYSFEADLTQTYTTYGHEEENDVSTEEEVITVDYVANGSESMDQDGYTVETRSESVEVSTGESFTGQVDTPLHMDYTCGDDVWVFVSGIESGSYTYSDQSGSYSIDYGDGSCDTIINNRYRKWCNGRNRSG